jgi:hypothetical protein
MVIHKISLYTDSTHDDEKIKNVTYILFLINTFEKKRIDSIMQNICIKQNKY